MNPVIIIPAFSRAHSLKRLLNSIENAAYPNDEIKLIISLDGGAAKDVVQTAKEFSFSHGQVEVIEREENLGLREHIIWCGDQTEKYGSVIVLEDDLIVDPYFFIYAREALQFYSNEEKVAGIALYSYEGFDYVRLPFIPMRNGTSGFFMQKACSSGQAWTISQWDRFRKWYNRVDENAVSVRIDLPENVRKWRESSWKKYYMAYLVHQDKFFFYPFQSYSTNCSDAGGYHIEQTIDSVQVNMAMSTREMEPFVFPKFEKEVLFYDAFMEPFGPYISRLLEPEYRDCSIDFFGSKPKEMLQKTAYCITSRRSRNPIKKIPLRYRPVLKNLEFMNEEITDGCLVLSRSEDVLYDDGKEVYFMLSKYFSRFALDSNNFMEPYIRQVYFKKKKERRMNWLRRKIRYPFRLFRRIFNQ